MSQGVLPVGVRLCPEAVRFLKRALKSLDAGLVASAWFWTERARRELDALTDGEGVEVEDRELANGG